MLKFSNPFKTLTTFEWLLWSFSFCVILLSFFLSGNSETLTLIASLIGVTALIFVAKGAVIGQVLTVLFSILYSVISLQFHYYGEMITYMGMSAPIAALSVISWLRHPFEKGKSEVEIAHLTRRQKVLMIVMAVVVTTVFYYVLKYFNTANLPVSTVSVTTSFLASYLMFYRNPGYALAYAANDIVLIVLWVLATLESISYLPMIVCFVMFFANDLYGFINWRRMKKKQKEKRTRLS